MGRLWHLSLEFELDEWRVFSDEENFGRPESLTDFPVPLLSGMRSWDRPASGGRGHGPLGIVGKAIGVTSAGCSVSNWKQFACDMTMGLHGRGPAVATGLKRTAPECIVFTYQGDGDLAAIGTGEIVHAAARCERITVIYVNNAVFGATGGQQAPTTLLGQKTTSFPGGRDPRTGGYPAAHGGDAGRCFTGVLHRPGFHPRREAHQPGRPRPSGGLSRCR